MNIESHNQSGGYTVGKLNIYGWLKRKKFFSIASLASLVTILSYFGINLYRSNHMGNINAKSYGQSGGITAGVINVNQKVERHLDEKSKITLDKLLEGIDRDNTQISVVYPGVYDEETATLAKEVINHLATVGWKKVVDGNYYGMDANVVPGEITIQRPPNYQSLNIYIGQQKN